MRGRWGEKYFFYLLNSPPCNSQDKPFWVWGQQGVQPLTLRFLFYKSDLLLRREIDPFIWLNHCYPVSLKKKNPLLSTLGTMKARKIVKSGCGEVGWGLATETVKIIQMQTPEVKFRQFIVNRITLALYHILAVSHALSSTSSSEKEDFSKSHG